MAAPGTLVARLNVASPTASATLPALQLTLNANRTYHLLRVEITQETSTTSGAGAIEVVTSSAVAPGTLATVGGVLTALNYTDTLQATLQTSGFSGALTGTQVVVFRKAYNILSGYLYLPIPEERLIIQGNGTNTKFLWLRLPVAPAATYNVELVAQEM